MSQFPEPWNPENLPPAEPGYRYLGKDEETRLDDEYWSEALSGWDTLNEILNRNTWKWTIRRRVPITPSNFNFESTTPMTTSPQPAKPTLKSGQAIVVNVHGNPILSRAVQDVAFEAGLHWTESKANHAYTTSHKLILFQLGANDKLIRYSDHPSFTIRGALLIDARTDMGLLIDLLAQPVVVVPKLNGKDGKTYEAQYAKGDAVVTFGCAKIDLAVFKAAHDMFDTPCQTSQSNRHLAGIVLSSGVQINAAEVREIFDYIKAVDKSSS